jgi:hypothetical protein
VKSIWVALGIVGSILVVVVILNTGGTTGGPDDPGSDVAVGAGEAPPEDAAPADIRRAEVRREGAEIVFEVTMSQEIPAKVPKGALEFRWDISENGDQTWIVTANLSSRLTAAVTSQNTSYGSSTIDDTMPGSVAADGDVLTVTLRASDIEAFPQAFNWTLKTTLDADLADPSSAVATDTAPDSGPGTLE